jgi:hypothetical protein
VKTSSASVHRFPADVTWDPPDTAFFDVVALDPQRALVLHSMRHPISGIPPDRLSDRPGPYLDSS